MNQDSRLSHVDATGKVTMVDVSAKEISRRTARASALVTIGPQAFAQLTTIGVKKGDAFTTAQLAGIIAAKRTCDLIPLCHGLMPEFVDVRFELQPPDAVKIWTEARVEGKTGVELEALTAAGVAALTLYDMCKAVSKAIVIGPIQLEEKTGGKSGDWRRT
ncbi:MAG: cyclic pyranopterin monophosphate synthase MoaC [Planctomycetes bacterium]|nr:cyclic pyranopterin monophosphate synthase MoaC [Planctomycetota bacterium]